MEASLFELASTQGLWAAMFIFLFMYQLRENKVTSDNGRNREDKLVTFIGEMSKNFERLAAEYSRLAEDVDYIKVCVIKGITTKKDDDK